MQGQSFQHCWLAKEMPRQFLEEEEGKQKWGFSPWAAVVWVFLQSPDFKSPSTRSPGIQIPLITDLQHDDSPDKMEAGLWQRSLSKYEAAAFSAACDTGFRAWSRGASQEGNGGTGPIPSPQPTGQGMESASQAECCPRWRPRES